MLRIRIALIQLLAGKNITIVHNLRTPKLTISPTGATGLSSGNSIISNCTLTGSPPAYYV